MSIIEIVSYTILSSFLIYLIIRNEKDIKNKKKAFNEKKFWEDRTNAYLKETRHMHKWKDVKKKK